MDPPADSGRDGSSGSSGSPDAEQQTELVSRKRSRPEGEAKTGDELAATRAFGLPPCFKEKDFF